MLKTSEGKWILFAVDGGKQGEFWPIDARTLLELGSHTTEPPEGVAPVIPMPPPRNVVAPQAAVAQTFVTPEGKATPAGPLVDLDALSKDELKALAEKRKITVARTDGTTGEPRKVDYIAALSPEG